MLKKTPLHQAHIDLGARMGPFGGWDMPIQYEGILIEHEHTRTEASIFDTCHMGEFDVKGPHALKDLEDLLTLNVETLKDGQCRYGFLLNEAGGVIDDLTCYRRSADHYFLVVNAGTLGKDAEWITTHLSPNTVFTDLSPERTKIDVQGPKSREIIEDIAGQKLPELGYFKFVDGELFGVPMTISRTGYTGEWGYEFYFSAEEGIAVWNKLTADGRIKPAGLGARDTLRLEMGYSLYGHELNDQMTPAAATQGMFIDLMPNFIGKHAVEKDLENLTQVLVPLELDSKRAAREGDKVCSDGKEVGNVTSGSLAPSLQKAVALAYVDKVYIDKPLSIEVRGKPLACKVGTLPFYKQGTARNK